MKSEKKSEEMLSHRGQGLSKAVRDLLSRVRASPGPEVVYGLPPDAAEAKAHSVIDPLVEGTGLPVARLNQYRWYLAELCRLMRTRSGPDLAYCMEFTIKKWLSFGLEPNSVVFLAGELFNRLGTRASPNDETRMTIETRSPNDRTEPPRGQESGGETAKAAKIAKVPDSATNATKECRHEEASESDTGPLESSTPGILPPVNDERGTSNERTSGGGGP